MSEEAKPTDGRDAYTRDRMQKIGALVDEELPNGWGFIVLAFPYNNPAGRTNYVAKADRKDVIKLMRDTADRLERQPEAFTSHLK